MKKVMSVILAAAMCLSLAACGDTVNVSSVVTDEVSSEVVEATSTPEPTPTPEPTATPEPTPTPTPEPIGKELKVGDTVTTEKHEFTVNGIRFENLDEFHRDNTTYVIHGGFSFVVELNFKNLDTTELEMSGSDRMENFELVYQDKYNYSGKYSGLSRIVPLESDTMFFYYTVPESMSTDTTGSIKATFTIDGEIYNINYQ